MSSFQDVNYWNKEDCELNAIHGHTKAVYDQNQLMQYYNFYGINCHAIASINGLKRYIIENNCKPIGLTLQGNVYSAIDIITGRRVVIKRSNKRLVKMNIATNGKNISEDIKNESNLLYYIRTSNKQYCDSCM